jgi:hypothetical protein
MPDTQRRFRWVYLLPLIHLSACLISIVGIIALRIPFLGSVWIVLMMVDLPISLLAYLVGWKYPALAYLWTLVAGTLWWYLLSRGAELAFRKLIARPPAAQDLFPRGDVTDSTRRQA